MRRGARGLASLKANGMQDRDGDSAILSIFINFCKLREADRRICWRRHSVVDLTVKTIGIFGVVVTASIALLQPAQGRSQGSTRSFSPAHHSSASSGHFSSRPRSFSGGNARFYRSSTRFSSQAAFRNRAISGPRFAVNRTTALNPRAYTASAPQLTASRRAALRSQGFTSSGRVLAASSRNWDRGRDHFWHGHRCHWHNNAWVIFDLGFYPWDYGWGYYPYGAYSYYDGGYYDDGAQSEYDGDVDSSVSQVQAATGQGGILPWSNRWQPGPSDSKCAETVPTESWVGRQWPGRSAGD